MTAIPAPEQDTPIRHCVNRCGRFVGDADWSQEGHNTCASCRRHPNRYQRRR